MVIDDKRHVPPYARSDRVLECLKLGECPYCRDGNIPHIEFLKYVEDREGEPVLVYCPSCGREAKLRDGHIPYEEDMEEFR